MENQISVYIDSSGVRQLIEYLSRLEDGAYIRAQKTLQFMTMEEVYALDILPDPMKTLPCETFRIINSQKLEAK